MANHNPNTSGLISLGDRYNNERTTIAEQGGIASGKKRREVKRIADIIYGIRKEYDIDPVVEAVKLFFANLQDKNAKLTDVLKALDFLKGFESEFRPNPPEKFSVERTLALKALIDAKTDEERAIRKAELEKYD